MIEYEFPPEEVDVKTVKELDPDQQPREKAEKFGCAYLSVPELWALILRVGMQRFPITELCRHLMKENDNSLHRLERRTREEIRGIQGIGPTKSLQIEAVLELIRRYGDEDIPYDEPIATSAQIHERMKRKIGNLDHEEVWALYLNRRNQVVRDLCLTQGTSVASLFDVKKVIKHALLENAEGVVLCHNHPSGNIQPSPQDRQITLDLKTACDCMKLRMLDHVIVTPTRYYSFHDNGVI